MMDPEVVKVFFDYGALGAAILLTFANFIFFSWMVNKHFNLARRANTALDDILAELERGQNVRKKRRSDT